MTANVTSNSTKNKTHKPTVFSEINSVIASNVSSNVTAVISTKANVNMTIQSNTTSNSTTNATVSVVQAPQQQPVNQLAGVKLSAEQEKQLKIGEILKSNNSQEEKQRLISFLDNQVESNKNPKIEQVEVDDDKITSEALIEKSVRDEEKKKMEDSLKELPKLDNGSLNKFDALNKAIDTFSKTLLEDDFHKAIKLHKEMRQNSLAQGETKLNFHTTEVFEAGFKQFPQIAQNEYVQDQLRYLDAAQANLNNNVDNDCLLEDFISRAKEVSKNLQTQYPEQWSSPLVV